MTTQKWNIRVSKRKKSCIHDNFNEEDVIISAISHS
jgi:hypothetical protein